MGLDYILKNSTVLEVMKTYLSTNEIQYSGHVILQLRFERGKKSDYYSGLYHNDQCGRRLKLFINLHDITKAHRPTLV